MIKYKVGDGYIRVGSSSNKLTRDDLESIYKTRFTKKDRKSDLEIEGYFGISDDIEIPKGTFKYVDLKVTNKSNKSIDFDIEIKFQKNKDYLIVSKGEFINKMQELQYNENKHFAYYTPTFTYESIHVHFEEYEDCVIISRNILAQKKTAVSLSQNSTEKNIFFEDLLILNEGVEEVNAEVTIRSDDFTEGSLIKNIVFKDKSFS